MTRISALVVFGWLLAVTMPICLPAQESRARSILFLDQSDLRGPLYQDIFSALQAAINTNAYPSIPAYGESRDVNHFGGEAYEESHRQRMQRWHVSEADLPPGSEVRFREASFWEQYRWQTTLVAAALLVQAGLILVLLHERRMRGAAEAEARQRLSEMAHVHRQALAGQLSSSIAHELNQPLGAILTNAETAEVILNSPNPDLSELKEIVADIRDDDIRASHVIVHLRSLLKRTPFEEKEMDANEIMREAFDLMSVQAVQRNVVLHLKTLTEPLRVKGDQIQLQQVIINLIANGMDAMAEVPFGRMIVGATARDGSRVLLSISDSGPGIAAEQLGKVFDPFFTTKTQGLGVGLSIARTIVDAHKGLIWVESQPEGGAVFRISLPLSAS